MSSMEKFAPAARLHTADTLRSATGDTACGDAPWPCRRRLLQALALSPWLLSGVARATASPAASISIATQFGRLPDGPAIRRIYAAGPPAGALVYALAPDRLLGWPMPLSPAARRWLSPATRDLPHVGRLAGRGSTLSLEALLALRPDLVLDAGMADATALSAQERVGVQTGLPCVLIHGRLTEHAAQLREVAALLGVAERGAELAAYADDTLATAAAVRDQTPAAQRPRVYYGRGSDGLETGLDGSINLESIAVCGGINVAASAGRGGLARVSLEQLLAWDPEVIVTQDATFAHLVRNDISWRTISAVRNGRVHCAPSQPFGWIDVPPSVNRLIGVHWLLAKLYPQHYGEHDLLAETERFYRLFYHSDATREDFARLLAEAA